MSKMSMVSAGGDGNSGCMMEQKELQGDRGYPSPFGELRHWQTCIQASQIEYVHAMLHVIRHTYCALNEIKGPRPDSRNIDF